MREDAKEGPLAARDLNAAGIESFKEYQQTERPAALAAALAAFRGAVAATTPGDPDLPKRLSNLASVLRIRFARSKDDTDLDAAIERWQRASQVPTGLPHARLAAARAWGASAAFSKRPRVAAEGHAAAVKLLPVVVFHGVDRATREERLVEWASLAAAACAVRDENPGAAVELLEQGRSVLWTQALNLRTDLTRLASRAPGLAERLSRVRQSLDTSYRTP
jgi:hypothetical protein